MRKSGENGEKVVRRGLSELSVAGNILRRASISLVFVFSLFALSMQAQSSRPKSHDSEQLGKAIDYFNSGKYHEALLIFEDLDARYSLNSRFRAYMGLCYYYEWDYEKACEYLNGVMADLDVYSPHERSIYYFTAAESHFNIGRYAEAIPLYERQINVCYDNEKADAFYRIGFCRMFLRDWLNARDAFVSALAYYERFLNNETTASRMAQLRNMIKGIDAKMNGKTEQTD